MPHSMDVVIYTQEQPLDEVGAPEVPVALTAMHAWFAENAPWGITEVAPEGHAWWDGPMFAGGFTSVNIQDLSEDFQTWGWVWPQEAVLIIRYEGDYTYIVRGDGARMDIDSGRHSHRPPGPPDEVDETALRVFALRESAGACGHCGQKKPRVEA